MRISGFILNNIDPIMAEWESFARSLPPGQHMTTVALRNDAERMLRFIAADIERVQSAAEQHSKAQGHGEDSFDGKLSAAEDHADRRLEDGFCAAELVSEYRALRASVTRLWLEASSITRDSIAQLVRFNEAIDQLLAESIDRFGAKQKRDQDLMLAVLGHDLRNPLHAISMTSKLIQRHPALAPALNEWIQRIVDGCTRMDRLINDLLAFASTRLGIVGLTAVPCDLLDIVRRVASEFESAESRGRIVVSANGDTAGVWDPRRLEQLVSNLIGNAIRHGSTDAPIEVAVQDFGKWVDLFVRNQGTPIPLEEQQAIFDPLRRGESTKPGGLGLGLYIVREIASAHRGTVEVTSGDPAGTVFHVRLRRQLPVLT